MFIRFFKNNSLIQLIGLLVLGIALWINVFLAPPPVVEQTFTSPLFNLISSLTSNLFVLITLAFLTLMVQALYLNHILIKHELVHRSSTLPAFVYLVLMSHSLQLQHLYPALISGLFVLAAIDSLLDIDEGNEFYRLSYRTGFFLGIASLFYLPTTAILLVVWVTLFIYRIVNWRPSFIPILGLLTPYLFLFTYYFWMDATDEFINHYLNYFSHTKLLFASTDGYTRIIMTILAFIITISFTRVLGRINDKKIIVRKKIRIMFALFLIGVLILFLNNDLIIHASIIYIPISIFIAIYFSDLRKTFWADLLFSLTVLLILFAHFQF